MEEDDNNGQEGEWNEDDSGDSGMEMMWGWGWEGLESKERGGLWECVVIFD